MTPNPTVLKLELALVYAYIVVFALIFFYLAGYTIYKIHLTIQCYKKYRCPIKYCILPHHCLGKPAHSKERQDELRRKIDALDEAYRQQKNRESS